MGTGSAWRARPPPAHRPEPWQHGGAAGLLQHGPALPHCPVLPSRAWQQGYFLWGTAGEGGAQLEHHRTQLECCGAQLEHHWAQLEQCGAQLELHGAHRGGWSPSQGQGRKHQAVHWGFLPRGLHGFTFPFCCVLG